MPIHYTNETPNLDQAFTLYQTTGWFRERPITTDDLMRAFENTQFMVAAYDGDQLVGFGRVVTDFVLHAMIYELIVLPTHQKLGIGGGILDQLVQYCLERNIRDIQLFCARGKRAFYEKRGFIARPDDAPGMQYAGTAVRQSS